MYKDILYIINMFTTSLTVCLVVYCELMDHTNLTDEESHVRTTKYTIIITDTLPFSSFHYGCFFGICFWEDTLWKFE